MTKRYKVWKTLMDKMASTPPPRVKKVTYSPMGTRYEYWVDAPAAQTPAQPAEPVEKFATNVPPSHFTEYTTKSSVNAEQAARDAAAKDPENATGIGEVVNGRLSPEAANARGYKTNIETRNKDLIRERLERDKAEARNNAPSVDKEKFRYKRKWWNPFSWHPVEALLGNAYDLAAYETAVGNAAEKRTAALNALAAKRREYQETLKNGILSLGNGKTIKFTDPWDITLEPTVLHARMPNGRVDTVRNNAMLTRDGVLTRAGTRALIEGMVNDRVSKLRPYIGTGEVADTLHKVLTRALSQGGGAHWLGTPEIQMVLAKMERAGIPRESALLVLDRALTGVPMD